MTGKKTSTVSILERQNVPRLRSEVPTNQGNAYEYMILFLIFTVSC